MDIKTIAIISSICGIAISGCTSLSSNKLLEPSITNTPSGLTYRLPAKQFSVSATYEITDCKQDAKDATNAVLDARISASINETLIGAEAYTIDYQRLNTWTKVTNTEFQLSEAGLLTGVNASIEDKSGAIISNTFSAAASIARGVAFPGISALGGDSLKLLAMDREAKPDAESINPCAPISKVLADKKNAEKEHKKAKEDDEAIAEASKNIRTAELQIKALTELADTYEKLGDDIEKKRLLERVKMQEKIKTENQATLTTIGESKSEEIAKKVEKLKGQLIVAGTLNFVPKANLKTGVMQVTSSNLDKVAGGRIKTSTIKLPEVSIVVEELLGQANEAEKAPLPNKIGIAYRIPVAAFARIYATDSNSNKILLLEKTTQIPQLGPMGSINLDNKMFDDNLIELAFNGSTGTPSKLTFRAKSKAEAASASFRNAADTYLQLKKDKRDDQIAANKAILEQATARVALEKAKTELTVADVKASADAAKTKAELEQSLVSSQLQLLRDQQRLDAVRTGTATASEVELEALNTQEKLLEQQLKILKLQQAITEQQTKTTPASAP